MHFTRSISQFSVLAALLGIATAVDMRAWQGTGCDNGASVYWSNVPAYTCITIPLSFGIRWYNIPSGAKAHAYYDSHCTNFAQEGGSGTYCLDAHNNMRSANWFWSSKFVRREEFDGETSSGVQYTTPEGTERRITASPSQFEYILALVKAEDWAALAQYPEGKP